MKCSAKIYDMFEQKFLPHFKMTQNKKNLVDFINLFNQDLSETKRNLWHQEQTLQDTMDLLSQNRSPEEVIAR